MIEEMERTTEIIAHGQRKNISFILKETSSDYNYGPTIQTLTLYNKKLNKKKTIQLIDDDFKREDINFYITKYYKWLTE